MRIRRWRMRWTPNFRVANRFSPGAGISVRGTGGSYPACTSSRARPLASESTRSRFMLIRSPSLRKPRARASCAEVATFAVAMVSNARFSPLTSRWIQRPRIPGAFLRRRQALAASSTGSAQPQQYCLCISTPATPGSEIADLPHFHQSRVGEYSALRCGRATPAVFDSESVSVPPPMAQWSKAAATALLGRDLGDNGLGHHTHAELSDRKINVRPTLSSSARSCRQ